MNLDFRGIQGLEDASKQGQEDPCHLGGGGVGIAGEVRLHFVQRLKAGHGQTCPSLSISQGDGKTERQGLVGEQIQGEEGWTRGCGVSCPSGPWYSPWDRAASTPASLGTEKEQERGECSHHCHVPATAPHVLSAQGLSPGDSSPKRR